MKRTFYINISNISKEELQKYLSKIKDKIESGEFDNKLDYTKSNLDNLDSYYIPIIEDNKKAYEIKDNEVYINDIKKVSELLEDK